jgi:hypothetical protein
MFLKFLAVMPAIKVGRSRIGDVVDQVVRDHRDGVLVAARVLGGPGSQGGRPPGGLFRIVTRASLVITRSTSW